MELNAMQKAAAMAALEKGLKAQSKETRAEADDEIIRLYEDTGADRVKVKIGDVEIGTFTVCFSKDSYTVTDAEAFHDFCLCNGLAHVKKSIRPDRMHEAISRIEQEHPDAIESQVVVRDDLSKILKRVDDVLVIEGTNEVVPGITPVPKSVSETRMTGCKPENVLAALSALPGGVEKLLMGGGDSE